MPLNQQKVIGIILEEVDTTEERCEGYHVMLRDTISDIIVAERLHREQPTTIQRDINDKCGAASDWLVERPDYKDR